MKTLLSLLVTIASVGAFAACPTGTEKNSQPVGKKAVTCVLKGTYTSDLTLTNENDYLLVGGVFIGHDNGKGGAEMVLTSAQLTIQPGTYIYALNPSKDPVNPGPNRKDFLVISRGSTIIAEGTADQPIVFTSYSSAPKRGDWGGLFINGMAPTNTCADLNNCATAGEAGTGYYGGNVPADNSGIVRYVRLEYSGDKINSEKEFNGITFNGTGSGTLVEYVQVYKTGDDGIEFFGGNVNVRYLVIVGAGDDSIDWTYGYTGMIQYGAVIQADDEADRGIEADNNSENTELEPRSNPTLSNITIVGSQVGTEGVYFRVGTSVHLANSIVTGFSKDCVKVKDAGLVKIQNNMFACTNLGAATDYVNNKTMANDELKLNQLMPQAGSPVLGAGVITDDMDLFFEDVDFIGAFDSQTDWTAGWTVGL